MTTGIYLEDHPPARSQFRAPRRAKPTGCIVVHTAESVMDRVGPDTGAENVAAFIAGRAEPGSYHRLSDADTGVKLVRFGNEAYGDGTGSNPWALHLAFACKTTDWAKMAPAKKAAYITQGAKAAAEMIVWLRDKHDVTVPLRRISRAASEAGKAGFIPHADRDPARRHDPGAHFPWEEFFAAVRAELARLDGPAKTPNITAFRLAKTDAERSEALGRLIAGGADDTSKAIARDWLEARDKKINARKALLAREVR